MAFEEALRELTVLRVSHPRCEDARFSGPEDKVRTELGEVPLLPHESWVLQRAILHIIHILIIECIPDRSRDVFNEILHTQVDLTRFVKNPNCM